MVEREDSASGERDWQLGLEVLLQGGEAKKELSKKLALAEVRQPAPLRSSFGR